MESNQQFAYVSWNAKAPFALVQAFNEALYQQTPYFYQCQIEQVCESGVTQGLWHTWVGLEGIDVLLLEKILEPLLDFIVFELKMGPHPLEAFMASWFKKPKEQWPLEAIGICFDYQQKGLEQAVGKALKGQSGQGFWSKVTVEDLEALGCYGYRQAVALSQFRGKSRLSVLIRNVAGPLLPWVMVPVDPKRWAYVESVQEFDEPVELVQGLDLALELLLTQGLKKLHLQTVFGWELCGLQVQGGKPLRIWKKVIYEGDSGSLDQQVIELKKCFLKSLYTQLSQNQFVFVGLMRVFFKPRSIAKAQQLCLFETKEYCALEQEGLEGIRGLQGVTNMYLLKDAAFFANARIERFGVHQKGEWIGPFFKVLQPKRVWQLFPKAIKLKGPKEAPQVGTVLQVLAGQNVEYFHWLGFALEAHLEVLKVSEIEKWDCLHFPKAEYQRLKVRHQGLEFDLWYERIQHAIEGVFGGERKN